MARGLKAGFLHRDGCGLLQVFKRSILSRGPRIRSGEGKRKRIILEVPLRIVELHNERRARIECGTYSPSNVSYMGDQRCRILYREGTWDDLNDEAWTR